MGSVYLIMLFTLINLALYAIMRPLRNTHGCILKCRKKIKKNFMWNLVIRLIMETALELSFCCFLNFPYFYRMLKPEGFFEMLDYLMTILVTLAIVIMPFWIGIFYNRNFV